jgi:thiol-disulfide isomerase/thioredoxin
MKSFIRISTICVFGIYSVTTRAQIGTNAPQAGDVPATLQLSKMIQGPPLSEMNWDSLKGKLVVLEFWNTGCKPCIQSIPHLNELAEHFKDKPVAFLSVSDDNENLLKKFLKEHPMKSWLALDGPENATERAFHLKGYGLVVLIDPNGKVAGFTLPAVLQQEHLDRILAGQGAGLPALKMTNAE